MLSRDTLLPIARCLEDGLEPQLRRYDAALARLRAQADASRLGPGLDELASWADVAPLLADLLAGPDGITEAVDDAGRIRWIGAAHARTDALRFVHSVTSRRHGRDRIAHPCSRFLVQGAHRICHPEGLDSVDHAGAPVTFQPGRWRHWSADDAAPTPGALDGLMTAWEAVFSSPLWDRRHPVVHAALAAITLTSLQPFPAGNAAIAQLVGHGVLRRSGAPVCPTFLAAEALEASGLDLLDLSVDEVMDRCRRFAAVLVAQLEAAPAHFERLQGIGESFAQGIPAFPARYTLSRTALARGVGGRPLDTPPSFAWRHRLTRDATQRILRRLIACGHLQLTRLNARQIVLSPAAIALLHDLTGSPDDAPRIPATATGRSPSCVQVPSRP